VEPAAECVAVALGGAALGLVAGAPFGVSIPLAVVGAANGAVCGWRGTYRWSSTDGAVAFVLDSTWASLTTGAGLVSLAIAAAGRGGGYDLGLSRRHNRHVYRRGFQPRRGFAITLGNVVSGVGDTTSESRRRLVSDHEDVHVWQARWFGPAYPVLYVAWIVGGGAAGLVVWAARHRSEPVTKVVESCAYYMNPFEWWAYSRAGHWPPRRAAGAVVWRRPIVAARSVRANAGTPAAPR
jgi:hypothetical protein